MNDLDLDIPLEALQDICNSYSNASAVLIWFDRLSIGKFLSLKKAKSFVRSHGFEPENKSSRTWKEYAFWLCAWQEYDNWTTNQQT